jgi:hypothetical protein
MIQDPDIFRAAKLLVARHGDAAVDRAERRARQLLSTGDAAAAALWTQVAVAIVEMTRGRRTSEKLT